MLPPSSRKDQSLAAIAWRLVKDLGGITVVIAAIVYASRLDASVSAFAKAAERFTAAIERGEARQTALEKSVTRDSVKLLEHERRLDRQEDRGPRRR